MAAADNQTFSEWAFPPALNATFVFAYGNLSVTQNETARGIPGLIFDAVNNLTVADRVDKHYANSGFGGNDAVVRVGDVIEADWKRRGNNTISLTCVVCTTGVEGGLVEDACDNYTRTANMHNKLDNPPALDPHGAYTIPSLAGYFPLEDANRTCAICIANLLSKEGFQTLDYTVPFPVLEQPAYPHKRFSAEHPTGIEDPSISDVTGSPLSEPAEHDDGNRIDVGMVVGVVVGVLAATMLFALLYWWMWKKRKGRAKVVNSGASSVVGQETGGGNRSAQSVALMRIQGVVRRPDTSAGEIPPPYHEAVRSGNTP